MTHTWKRVPVSVTKLDFWTDAPFSRGHALTDLYMLAVTEDTRRFAGGRSVILDSGMVPLSVRQLSIRWGWSRGKTERFLLFLGSCKICRQKRARNGASKDVFVTMTYDENYNDSEATNEVTDEAMNSESYIRNKNKNILSIQEETKNTKKQKRKPNSTTYDEQFTKAWIAYGRVGGKAGAAKAWAKLTDEHKTAVADWAAAEYVKDRDPVYTAHFSTYLNDGRYLTQIEDRESPITNHTTPDQSDDDYEELF